MIFAALALATSSVPARPLILAYGDSLTAGYNLERGLGFAPQLQATLRRRGIAATVVDGGVSGDTTTAGAARLSWTLSGLPRRPDLVILELGANDMLRTLDPAIAAKNLDAMVTEFNRRHIPVLIAGMRAAPNLDPAYREKFDGIFANVSKKYRARLYPFFLDGVAGNPNMQQSDGLHPTFAGIRRIVTGIVPSVLSALNSTH